MAVQKSKKTRSKIGMRRSHDRIKINNILINKNSKEIYIFHRSTKNGYYKNKLFLIKNNKN